MFGNLKESFDGFGNFGHIFGKNGFGPKFGRGDIKLIILDLLQSKPRHGYEIIQELEKKFFGCYTPSSGTIYPTLQLLEDQDLVTSDQKEGKKVYTISEFGITFLENNKSNIREMLCRTQGPWGEHGELMAEIKNSFAQTAQLMFAKLKSEKLSNKQKDELKAVFNQLTSDVTRIISDK